MKDLGLNYQYFSNLINGTGGKKGCEQDRAEHIAWILRVPVEDLIETPTAVMPDRTERT